MNKKRIFAIITLVLIALLYIATLILAFLDSPFAKSCLMAAMFCTIVLPVVGYAFLLIHRTSKDKGTDQQGDESG